MNPRLARHLYHGIQFLRREPVKEKLSQLLESQWYDPGKLREMQFERLRSILIHARQNIPFYQKRFNDCGFNPNSFNHPDELLKIPPLTKENIQQNLSHLIDRSYKGPSRLESTSGSSGNPLTFRIDREFAAGFRAEMYRGHQWAGLDIGAKEGRIYGIPIDTLPNIKEKIKDALMNRRRLSVFDLSDTAMHAYWRILDSFKPQYLHGYTSGIYRFTDFVKRKNLKPSFSLISIIPTAEVLQTHEKELMEEVWNAPVFNEYGCSETGILASQCGHGSMHMNAENNFVEFIAGCRHAGPDEQAEIIVTNLNNKVMPFIRYKLGDIASFKNEPCRCGRTLPLMNLVEGRLSSMLLTPAGRVVSGWLFYYALRGLLERNSAPRQLRVFQKAINHIHFVVEGEAGNRSRLENLLEKKCHEHLDPRMRSTFEFVKHLPPSPSGKLLHFVSELDVDIAGNQYKRGMTEEE
jgi:phenylacetate-CoA ligase